MKKKQTLVVIDDDQTFVEVLSLSLSMAFNVFIFSEPELGIRFIKENTPDAVLLDFHMGETDGMDVCHRIRSFHRNLPVFFFSSDSEIERISDSLNVGGCDFFLKTIPSSELIIRIKGRIKNTKLGQVVPSLLKCGPVSLYTLTREVKIDGVTVKFTPKEYEILKFFLENQNQVFTKIELMERIWPNVKVDSNNLDTHLFHMRKKLPESSDYIVTLKGVGYILRTEQD